jgi:hypothetical protein
LITSKFSPGIAIMIEDAISPKTPEATRKFIENGGKLKVGGDVLIGLDKWETLVGKPPTVDVLLKNMSAELKQAQDTLKANFASAEATEVAAQADEAAGGKPMSARQVFTEVGFGQKGKDLYSGKMENYTSLLTSPWVLHSKPRSIGAKTHVQLLTEEGKKEVVFNGFLKKPDSGELILKYSVNGEKVFVTKSDPDAVKGGGGGGDGGAREAGENEFGMPVPGQILSEIRY